MKGSEAPVLSDDHKAPPHETRVIVLPCLHSMHVECYAKLETRDLCPVCREAV